jgi:chemotaxis protein MotB
LPIRNERFPSNWELSVGRATNVTRFLIEVAGIAPVRLAATGYAEFRPVAPNDSEENRTKNRRVDIVLLSLDTK